MKIRLNHEELERRVQELLIAEVGCCRISTTAI
jgi:hypothetical protein